MKDENHVILKGKVEDLNGDDGERDKKLVGEVKKRISSALDLKGEGWEKVTANQNNDEFCVVSESRDAAIAVLRRWLAINSNVSGDLGHETRRVLREHDKKLAEEAKKWANGELDPKDKGWKDVPTKQSTGDEFLITLESRVYAIEHLLSYLSECLCIYDDSRRGSLSAFVKDKVKVGEDDGEE